MGKISNRINAVSSVTEYLELLPKDSHWLFRGESMDFGETRNTATLFRSIKEKNVSIPRDDKNHMEKIFLSDLGFSILEQNFYAEMQHHDQEIEENFIAYCQHHGLRTPLLDVSTSPLVALYFACVGNENEDGFVYGFKDKNILMLNSNILKYSERGTSLDPLSSKNIETTIQLISNKLVADGEEFEYENYLNRVIFQQAKEYAKGLPAQDEHDTLWALKNFQGTTLNDLKVYLINADTGFRAAQSKWNTLTRAYANFLLIYYPDSYPNHERDIVLNSNIATNYPMLIRFIVSLFYGNSVGGEAFNAGLYYSVKPTVNFERMKAQSGQFIFQTSSQFSMYYGKSMQKKTISLMDASSSIANPMTIDRTIKVTNKSNILFELDRYGINRKSLFMDDDSLASYLVWHMIQEL